MAEHSLSVHTHRLNSLCRICGERSKRQKQNGTVRKCASLQANLTSMFNINTAEESNTKHSTTLCKRCYSKIYRLQKMHVPSEVTKAIVINFIEKSSSIWTEFDETVTIEQCKSCWKFDQQIPWNLRRTVLGGTPQQEPAVIVPQTEGSSPDGGGGQVSLATEEQLETSEKMATEEPPSSSSVAALFDRNSTAGDLPADGPSVAGLHKEKSAMAATVRFSKALSKSDPTENAVLIVGQTKHLAQLKYEDVEIKFAGHVDRETYTSGVTGLHPGPTDSCSLWLHRVTVAALPNKCSRHNTPSRAHSLTKVIRGCVVGGEEFVVLVCELADLYASACAIARAFPSFSGKSNVSDAPRTVTVEIVLMGPGSEESLSDSDVDALTAAAYGVRLAAKIVDMPCADMHTDAFLEEVKAVGSELSIVPEIIRGDELRQRGFGGIYGVGKCAIHPPALAILSHKPPGATKNIALVGKGIVYDTGGLCLKSKTGMCGMKRDCGGAAGVLGAFYSAVKLGFTENLHALFCLAENAIGPEAQRPDDIVKMYSGRTVEINNTDAEGRLVLGDGVAYANKDLKCETIVDMATLTGAQGIATGKFHAGIVTNSEDMEAACVRAGRNSGDLVHALPYTPELHFAEFSSVLADMKNSVAERSNAQVSCAGLFIQSHIGFDYTGTWLHIDMASPVFVGERATGYGVALLTTLFGCYSQNRLLRSIGPDSRLSNKDGNGVNENNSAPNKKIRLN